MDRPPEYYLNEARKNQREYRKLLATNSKRAQTYNELALKWMDLYKKKMKLQEEKKKIEGIQNVVKKGTPIDDNIRDSSSSLGINIEEDDEEVLRELDKIIEEDKLKENQLLKELDELVEEERLKEKDVVDDKGKSSESIPLKSMPMMSSINMDNSDNEEEDDEEDIVTPEISIPITQSMPPPVSPINSQKKEEPLPPPPSRVVSNAPPVQIKSTPSSNPSLIKRISDRIKNKTRKNRKPPTTVDIEMKEFSKPKVIQTRKTIKTPTDINIEPKIIETRKKREIGKLGFSETLENPPKEAVVTPPINPNLCQNIFVNGSKVTKKFFYPSEFPKLTKIKPITVSIKKGGKRKSRKGYKKTVSKKS